MQQISSILTEYQRQYLIEYHSDCKSMSAIAEKYGVARSTVWRTIQLAYKNLREAGITPPDKKRVSLEQKGGAQVWTVDPFILGEMAEG